MDRHGLSHARREAKWLRREAAASEYQYMNAVGSPEVVANKTSPARVAAARTRLKTGRNDSCPCGSGRKYKKCCLESDDALVRNADATRVAKASTGASSPTTVEPFPLPPSGAPNVKERKPIPLTEAEVRWNAFWDGLEALGSPGVAQMDHLLGKLLQAPEGDDWGDVLHAFAKHNHPDLLGVFRKISGVIAHTKEAGIAFFYWAAAEEFIRAKRTDLLPEVAAGFCKLDAHSYDADALVHLEDYLLAAHFESETLQLAERFLPAGREGVASGKLMPHAVGELSELIFQLRLGLALRSETTDAGASAEEWEKALRQGIEDEIDVEAASRGGLMIFRRSPAPTWTRADFELVCGDIRKSQEAWQQCLRLYDTLMGVAREAWEGERFPSGIGFRGLNRLLESIYEDRDRKSSNGTPPPKRTNLLDYLVPAGLDERVARSCRGILGLNISRAQLMLEAYGVLLRFAERHQLVSRGNAAATHSELIRLRRVLDN